MPARLMKLAALLGGLALGLALPAFAQDTEPTYAWIDKSGELAGAFELDTAVPDSPGFSAIGLQPSAILDPGGGRVKVFDLVNYLDEDGNLKSGFALGGTPFWWLRPDYRLDSYRNDLGRWGRAFARTEISLGFSDGGDGKADKLGLGFRTDLLDGSDYRMDDERYACFQKEALTSPMDLSNERQKLLTKHNQSDARRAFESRAREVLGGGAAEAQVRRLADSYMLDAVNIDLDAYEQGFDERRAKGKKTCDEAATKRYAGRMSWIIAAGLAAELDNLAGDDFESSGGAVWSSFRMPIGKGETVPNYFGVFARYDVDRIADGDPLGPVRYDSGIVAVLAGYETRDSKLSLQLGYQTLDYETSTVLEDDDFVVGSIAYSRRLDDGLWLELKAGRSDRADLPDEKDDYLLLQMKWANTP